MTAEQFTYWLQGFAEIGYESPTPEQWNIIKDRLALVFTKVTPNYDKITTQLKDFNLNPQPMWYTNSTNPIPGTLC